MTNFIVRIRDMGCIQNALPVARILQGRGADVALYLEKGGMAETKMKKEDFPFMENFPSESSVLSCLPTEAALPLLEQGSNPIVLIQENPDPEDERFQQWIASRANIQSVCGLIGNNHPRFEMTGLPAIDEAANSIQLIDRETVREKINLDEVPTISIALPGDLPGAMQMLDLLEPVSRTSFALVAGSHPKLKGSDPDGYQRVSDRIKTMAGPSLEAVNGTLSPFEIMALAVGTDNHLVVAHNSTMGWQAAAAGVQNVRVVPPQNDDGTWAEKAPIITSSYGTPLTAAAAITPHVPKNSLTVGNSAEKITEILLRSS